MVALRSLPQFFRSSEWIFLIAHLGMLLSSSTRNNFWVALLSSSVLFLLTLVFPFHRPRWQRLSYVVLGTTTVIGAGLFGVNFGLFLQVYAAKTYFLLGRKTAIAIVVLTAVPWTINEYLKETRQSHWIQPIQFNLQSLH
jgi:FtsH-binding integral membrane protein